MARGDGGCKTDRRDASNFSFSDLRTESRQSPQRVKKWGGDMSISSVRNREIDYAPCRYNGSRVWYRGPAQVLQSPYVVCLGGSETYGRYVLDPYPSLLATALGKSAPNLGVENAGLDVFLNDPGTLLTISRAKVAVIQLSGSHNTSNRYYSVHPRRNDRFLKACGALTALYPEVDFTEVHFTRHLLEKLSNTCEDRFAEVAREAQRAWLARMKKLLSQITGKTILFWFSPVEIPAGVPELRDDNALFMDAKIIHSLKPWATEFLKVVPADWHAGKTEMFNLDDHPSRALHVPGPGAHDAAATALLPVIKRML